MSFAKDEGPATKDPLPFLSITIFAVAVVAGLESLWGAALAGLIYAVPSGPTVRLLSSVMVIATLVLVPGGLVQLPKRLELKGNGRRLLALSGTVLRGAIR